MPPSSKLKVNRAHAFSQQGGRCFYCGVLMWLHDPHELPGLTAAQPRHVQCTAEHLQPRVNGGSDAAVNIVAACAHCNRTRHKRRRPPSPLAFRGQVARRVLQGRWHPRWVFSAVLLEGQRRAPNWVPAAERSDEEFAGG